MKKVLFTATVDSHIIHFHIPFLKLFKENGYEVHVATNGDENIPYCDKKYVIPFQKNPFKLNNIKAIFQLRKIVEEEKYELIHTHTPMGSVVTRLASKKTRIKYGTRVMYTAHGFHFFKGAPKLNWMLFYPVEKYLSKYTDTLITINQEDYLLAKNKFKKCKDIQYVPGVGIDEEKFEFEMSESEKLSLRKSLDLDEDDFVIIYPAEISNRKRQIWLVESIKELLSKHEDIKLLLPGKDLIDQKLHKYILDNNLQKSVKILGYRKDIPKLLKISNLSVSSAKQEGLPVNLMEAMYVGLPIVATDCRGNRDLISDNGFVVNNSNKKDFEQKLISLYNNRALMQDFGNKSKINVTPYLLENILIRMNNIYFS